jgi:hypothetical protein
MCADVLSNKVNQLFNNLWIWSSQVNNELQTLGSMLNEADENQEESSHSDAPGPFPPSGHFRIVSGEGDAMTVLTPNGKQINFTRDAAEATWHSFHGLRQASLRATRAEINLPDPLIHRMTIAYIRSADLGKALPQNWMDCPQPWPAPCYITAAIRHYCLHHPDSTILFSLA